MDKMLKIIHRKLLKGIHLPIIVMWIQATYLNSPYFKAVYLYLVHNKLPLHKEIIRGTEILAERYSSLDSLLFRLNTTPGKQSAALAVS